MLAAGVADVAGPAVARRPAAATPQRLSRGRRPALRLLVRRLRLGTVLQGRAHERHRGLHQHRHPCHLGSRQRYALRLRQTPLGCQRGDTITLSRGGMF